MSSTDSTFLDAHVPTYWDGLLFPVTNPAEVPFVLGAVLESLGRHDLRAGDEAPVCVRTRLAFEAPRGDRVWVVAEQGGQPRSWVGFARDVAGLADDPLRSGLAPWIEDIRPELAGSFDVDSDEVLRRCLPHYHGFLHAWTDEHTARDNYRTWPRARQAEFLHEYLVYAANDARAEGRAGDVDLQAAAAWVASQRRYLLRWTVVLRSQPQPRTAPNATLAARIFEAVQGLAEALSGAPAERYLQERLEEAVRGDQESNLEEVLRRAELPEGRRRPIAAWAALHWIAQWDPPHDRLTERWSQLREATDVAGRWMW